MSFFFPLYGSPTSLLHHLLLYLRTLLPMFRRWLTEKKTLQEKTFPFTNENSFLCIFLFSFSLFLSIKRKKLKKKRTFFSCLKEQKKKIRSKQKEAIKTEPQQLLLLCKNFCVIIAPKRSAEKKKIKKKTEKKN